MKRKWLAASSVALALILGLFLFLPLPYSHQGKFVIEPAEQIPVRAEAEGFIGGVLVKEGDTVSRGSMLAVMRDINLEQKRDSLQSQISLLGRDALLQRAHADTAQAIQSEQRRDELGQEMAQTESQLASLIIAAPVDGVVMTPRVEDKVGNFLSKGAELCRLAPTSGLRARVVVDDWDLKDVEVGAETLLRLSAGGTVLQGHVITVAPASQLQQRISPIALHEAKDQTQVASVNLDASGTANRKKSAREQEEAAADVATSPYEAPLVRFDTVIALDGDPGFVKPGMSGDVKIYGKPRPLAVIIGQGVRDWFRSKVWW